MKQGLLTIIVLLLSLSIQAQTDSLELQQNQPEMESGEDITTPGDSLTQVSDSTDSDKKKKRKKKEKRIKAPKAPKPPREKIPPDTIARPTIGVGLGVLSFNGDIKSNENRNLFSGGFGTQIMVSQELSQSFDVSLSFLLGQLSANERSLERNLNFRTDIFAAGINFRYNFNHILNEKRKISPYITLGVENIEFTTKTDLRDRFGNTYHFWSDGTIRNLPENSPNSEQSVLLQRDYVYETDIRSQDYDGRGDYAERSFGIPVGVGAEMDLTSKIRVGLNYTYHFTFTDDMDGVNGNSTGDRIGSRPPNTNNDKFWMLSASISYNFTRSKSGEIEIEDKWTPQELLAFGNDDYDGDGVYDFMDQCPQTPLGEPVDERGCPLSKKRPPTLTDEQIYERYLAYMDSSGLYTQLEKRFFSSLDKKRLVHKKRERSYKIKIGEFVGGVPQAITNMMLGLPDVETHVYGDTTIFTVGDFDNLPEAIQRKIKAAMEGFEDAEIVMMDENGRIRSLGDEGGNIDLSGAEGEHDHLHPFVFRVQLGAFKRKKPDEAFKHVQNLVVVENEQGYTKYMSGAFNNYVEAAKHKVEMIDDGWKGAFVVAYKRAQGNRVDMEQAGVTEDDVVEAKKAIAETKAEERQQEIIAEEQKKQPFDKSRVKFKVQIGIYKNQVPPDVLSEYMKLNNLAEIEVDQSSAAKRYTSGEFSDYQSAVDYRNKLINKGFETAFIIALKDGELISIEEAKKLLEE